MPFQVIVTRDFDHMSEVAAKLATENIQQVLAQKSSFALGLAAGHSPTGLYKHLARAANAGAFDASRIVSFNLDEYIGLPGKDAPQRATHPESFGSFMNQELFGLLQKKFLETNVPGGALIAESRFTAEMKNNPDDWSLQGVDSGKTMVIHHTACSEYLRWIRTNILDAYANKIARQGGMDLQIVGVGGRGHVGFHEAGIPFENNPMLLARLADDTTAQAVADGHFATPEECPRYAVSMGASLIYKARTVLLLAQGTRKADPVANALFMTPNCSVPISYGHILASQGGRMIFVLDQQAAAKVLGQKERLRDRGIDLDDRSSQHALVRVADLKFSRDPGLMG